ncbi:hypothetical protein MU0053_000261 [[Mycobacterium] burgundiense]|uniref:DUF7847 domain-containing protein n=2 Tax=[Mycobacterium] burgundiense TaxID=3064286 RepID=A0ABM9L999_9MYCO|nr:hypothetical protein [Mycolicibacterium sp. MU0053]CAJ1495074.1 hypothetical protein MU0053_000261 [Mycolicibacterium sp. MU0053]
MELRPGVIPLRPLTLSDLYNGAVGFIRTNPKASLGLTAIVVILTQTLALILQLGPMQQLATADPESTAFGTAFVDSVWTELPGMLISALAAIVLTGMLTVVVGRAVFGSPISIGETWYRIRDRILALIGVTLLVSLAYVVLILVAVVVIAALAAAAGTMAAALIGIPLALVAVAAMLWISVVTAFAPVIVVLERQPILASLARSYALIRGDFWRVLGIWLLTRVVTYLVAMAVAVPFMLAAVIAGGLVGASSTAITVAALLATVGAIVGQIITTPFTAGVTVLLYTDRRIRAEAFDLVLRTGATTNPADPQSTDHLWWSR